VTIANPEQAEHWNGEEAEHWVAHQARYDQMLAPFVDMLLEGGALGTGDEVLDVGCGCGATTLATARAVTPAPVLGVDLSAPMLARARSAATAAGLTNALFEQADVQVHAFPDEAFEAVISRFGIMFFSDPVAAFANLHRAAKANGRLAFVCWQELAANEWLLVPGAAITKHVPLPDLGAPGSPGMFAFSDPARVQTTLSESGWRDIAVTPRHTPILVGGGGTLDEAIEFLRTGSMGRTMLGSAEPDVAAHAIEAVHLALSPHTTDDGVRLDAAVWLVSAHR
jgi:SAM-dependent methyltransferase